MKAFQNKSKAFIAIVAFSLIGKFLGVAREIASAYFFGTSEVLAVFWVALFTLAIVVVIVNDTVTPFFASTYMAIIAQEENKSKGYATQFILLMTVFISGVAVLLYLFSPYIVSVVVTGFTAEMRSATVDMARLLLPWFILSCLVNLMGAIQQCHEKYTLVALNNSILNVVILLCLGTMSVRYGIGGLLFGYNLAIFAQLLFHIAALQRIGIGLSIKSLKLSGFAELMATRKIIAFSKLGWVSIVKNVEPLLDYYIGSLISATAIAVFTYAGKINILFFGLLISPFSAIFLPYLSKLSAENNIDVLHDTVNRNIRYYILMLLPAAAFIVFHRIEIIQVLFQRGSFDAAATLSTSMALSILALALPFLGILEVLKNAFYGQQHIDAMLFSYTIGLIGKLCIGLSLYRILGSVTLPLAVTSYVVIVTVVLLFFHFRSSDHAVPSLIKIAHSVIKTGACITAGIALISSLEPFIGASATGGILIRLVISFIIFVLVFCLSALLLKHEDFKVCYEQTIKTLLSRFRESNR